MQHLALEMLLPQSRRWDHSLLDLDIKQAEGVKCLQSLGKLAVRYSSNMSHRIILYRAFYCFRYLCATMNLTLWDGEEAVLEAVLGVSPSS